MKKTYMQPALEAIEMKYTTTLMAGSDVIGFGGIDGDAGDALAPSMDEGFDFGDDNAFVFEEETFDYSE